MAAERLLTLMRRMRLLLRIAVRGLLGWVRLLRLLPVWSRALLGRIDHAGTPVDRAPLFF
jgi:hypothetical protein